MKPLSLYELNSLVRELIAGSFTDTYWVTAELSEVRVAAKGHCFLELVEQGERGAAPIAKARAVVYANLFPMLKLAFEEETGQQFRAGLKVQMEVEVSFHEAYGYSLVVKDIDPAYTLGSMAQLRRQILAQLEREGVMEMNKSLRLPRPLQRIAVISSATAAGYGDFCNQLDANAHGYVFSHRLFPAVMQGEATAGSVIAALDAIASEADSWDAVVIIRGGGAVSDLAGFESYDLANCCAQFPLPVIVGIGHERDTTVLDFVANTSLKTPTAVAAFLIEGMDNEARFLNDAENAILDYAGTLIHREKERITALTTRINHAALSFCANREARLSVQYERISQYAMRIVLNHRNQLQQTRQSLLTVLRHYQQDLHHNLEIYEQAVAHYSPDNVLRLGYSITRMNGKAVTSAAALGPGDTITTQFADGTTVSTVRQN